jgi:hypothetical protein
MVRMQFTKANLDSLTLQPTEKGLKAVLLLSAPLTTELAEDLKCGFVYDTAGNPREHIKAVPLDHVIRDVDIHLPSGTSEGAFDALRPELIHSIKVTKEDEFKLSVSMRVHVCGKNFDLLSFAETWSKKEFEFALTSLQESFDFSGDNPGSTAVDMSSGEVVQAGGPLFSCEHCDAEIELTPDGTGHVLEGGEVAECKHPSARKVAEEGGGPALASAREVNGRKKRKVQQIRTPEEIEEDVDVVVQ